MSADRVLVAFSNRTGSTAALAEVIAGELADAGLTVDTLAAGDVADLEPYHSVVLGSGVFLPRRMSDGGGFLTRHVQALADRAVWLFCAGPIGALHAGPTDPVAVEALECAVVTVARAIGARGAAAFGCQGPNDLVTGPQGPHAVDLAAVREWAGSIAVELGYPGATDAAKGRRAHGKTAQRGLFGHRQVPVTG